MSVVLTPVRRRAVVCVIEELHRDRAVADAAVVGRFFHCGVELTIGLQPDWMRDGLPDDEEWRIEWVKSYEGLDLAQAHRSTRDPKYVATWCRLVDAFIVQVPVGHDSSDVSARRIQNWIYAAQLFGSDALAAHDDGFEHRLAARLTLDVEHLSTHLTAERNHRTLELYAVLIAALAFPDTVDDDETLLRMALGALEDNVRTDLWVDGTHRECSTDYHLIVLRSLLGVIANARRFRLPLSAGFSRRVERAAEWAMHVQRPDGTTPSFSDGDVADHRSVIRLAGTLFHRADFQWVGSSGAIGHPPAVTAVTFPVGGYVVQRSGWGTARDYGTERFALFDCGPLGDGGHGHYDQLHVELVAGPHVLAIDPGRFTYADTPWRHRFKGTAAHNTVTVDGLDQTPYRRGKPKGAVSTASLLGRERTGPLDLVTARVESPAYDAVHTRRLAFCGGEYWVVHDRMQAPTEHRYELRWHLSPEVDGRIELVEGEGLVTVVSPWATYAVAGADSVHIEDGWVSSVYGIKEAAPVIVASCTTRDADLVTAIVPRAGSTVDRLVFSELGVEADVRSDRFRWPLAGGATWVRR